MTLDSPFLTEVEDFFDSCDLLTLPLSEPSKHDVNINSETSKSGVEQSSIGKTVIDVWMENGNAVSLETRLASEARHRQLRSAIAAQTTLIRAYQSLTYDKLVNVESLERGGSRNYYHCDRLRLESFDSEFYRTSARTFNAVYFQTDTVFDAAGLDATDEHCGALTQEQRVESDNSYFQHTYKRKFPFDFAHACGMLKRTLSVHLREDQQLYDGIEDPGSIVAIKFRVSTRLKIGKDASVLLRVINRQYREDDRMVVVWRTFAEGEEGAFAGMHADELGWCVVSGDERSSVLRLYACYMPMNFMNEVVSDGAVLAKRFADMVVEASTSNCDEIAGSLEKFLLNDQKSHD
ncbi:hypothetical protein F441_21334 [Phytophthora nicotianae CJ01A1]|uniref:START domain-containing protein n=3 Tax=Phytophthora nicotianae TaxID=4792 RepID=W2VVJ1_PHYNI|nr:hypothetical protein L916_20735 [Phytophthora nicotianae]ETP01404.1 hypothetical protein F441_21334 [Phytophthora nicotianae CJ01A1]